MNERCFRLIKSARTEEYECLLTRTSSAKHERTVKIGKDKKRLKEHVLAHHTGLDLSSLEGTPSNPGAVKKVDALIGEYNRNDASSVANFFERAPQPTNTPERDFALWVMAAKVPFYQLQGPLFRNFLHAVPKLPGGFNPREVVYRQMELIKAETVEKMNELLEGVNFVSITSDSWTANHQHFLSVVVHGISSDFKNHLVLPLPLAKLDLLGSGDIVEKVFGSVSAALPGKRIAVATTDNGTSMTKGMRDGRIGRWHCAVHMLNRVIKSTMEK